MKQSLVAIHWIACGVVLCFPAHPTSYALPPLSVPAYSEDMEHMTRLLEQREWRVELVEPLLYGRYHVPPARVTSEMLTAYRDIARNAPLAPEDLARMEAIVTREAASEAPDWKLLKRTLEVAEFGLHADGALADVLREIADEPHSEKLPSYHGDTILMARRVLWKSEDSDSIALLESAREHAAISIETEPHVRGVPGDPSRTADDYLDALERMAAARIHDASEALFARFLRDTVPANYRGVIYREMEAARRDNPLDADAQAYIPSMIEHELDSAEPNWERVHAALRVLMLHRSLGEDILPLMRRILVHPRDESVSEEQRLALSRAITVTAYVGTESAVEILLAAMEPEFWEEHGPLPSRDDLDAVDAMRAHALSNLGLAPAAVALAPLLEIAGDQGEQRGVGSVTMPEPWTFQRFKLRYTNDAIRRIEEREGLEAVLGPRPWEVPAEYPRVQMGASPHGIAQVPDLPWHATSLEQDAWFNTAKGLTEDALGAAITLKNDETATPVLRRWGAMREVVILRELGRPGAAVDAIEDWLSEHPDDANALGIRLTAAYIVNNAFPQDADRYWRIMGSLFDEHGGDEDRLLIDAYLHAHRYAREHPGPNPRESYAEMAAEVSKRIEQSARERGDRNLAGEMVHLRGERGRIGQALAVGTR